MIKESKLILMFFLILPFYTYPNESYGINGDNKILQASCASLMYDIQKQYGKSFICNTNENNGVSAFGSNIAMLTNSLNGNETYTGIYVRFSDMYYDGNGILYYSYNINDFNNVILRIQHLGLGLTQKQMNVLACNKGINDMNKAIKKKQ